MADTPQRTRPEHLDEIWTVIADAATRTGHVADADHDAARCIAQNALAALTNAGYAVIPATTVTTSCRTCQRTIEVPVELFNTRPVATCADVGVHCLTRDTPLTTAELGTAHCEADHGEPRWAVALLYLTESTSAANMLAVCGSCLAEWLEAWLDEQARGVAEPYELRPLQVGGCPDHDGTSGPHHDEMCALWDARPFPAPAPGVSS